METPPPNDAQSAFPPPTGLALASLLLGIGAVGLSFLVIGFLVGAVGIALGFAYLSKKRGPTGMARWGIGLSIFGMLLSVGFAALFFHYYSKFKGSFAGGPMMAPTAALAHPSSLTNSSSMLKSNLVWAVTIPKAEALCAGDWQNDGSTRVLVGAGRTLHVLDLTGVEGPTVTLPDRFTSIECGHNKITGTRLLGYKQGGQKVFVMDRTGKVLWSEAASIGVDGAHWGDLKGDGNDCMAIGMNGFGGMEVLSSEGRQIWSVSLGNVWGQSIFPAANIRPGLVVATDATGSIHVFDATGKGTNVIRPEGGFYTQIATGAGESNTLQILAFTQDAAVACDQTGKTAWISAAPPMATRFAQHTCAVAGDFKGDGTRQWAFVDGNREVTLATTGGQKLSSIPIQGTLEGMAVAPRAGQGALLIILDGGGVEAYSFAGQ